MGGALHEARSLAAGVQTSLARALRAAPRRDAQLHLSIAAPPRAPVQPAGGDGASLGLLYALLAALGVTGAALAVRAASGARSRRASGGRWVRDRSLGGKMVRARLAAPAER